MSTEISLRASCKSRGVLLGYPFKWLSHDPKLLVSYTKIPGTNSPNGTSEDEAFGGSVTQDVWAHESICICPSTCFSLVFLPIPRPNCSVAFSEVLHYQDQFYSQKYHQLSGISLRRGCCSKASVAKIAGCDVFIPHCCLQLHARSSIYPKISSLLRVSVDELTFSILTFPKASKYGCRLTKKRQISCNECIRLGIQQVTQRQTICIITTCKSSG